MVTELNYSDHIEELKKWMQTNADHMVDKPEARTWCLLGITEPLLAESIHKHFSNVEINKQYAEEFNKNVLTNVPVAYLQLESDSLHSLAKMYIYRHQPRLKNYRDDCENKFVRNYSSLSLSLAKLGHLKSLT
jgi:hypothetical protein